MRDIVDRLRAVHPSEFYLCYEAADEIDRLRARLAEAERDAARYRWLRRGLSVTAVREAHKIMLDELEVVTEEGRLSYNVEVDAAIDAAMRSTDSAGGVNENRD